MKKIKLMLISMICISLSVMGVKAGDTCKITENKLTQDKITADCRIVEISEDTTIDSGVTIEIKDKIVILDNGKTLTVEGILNIKDFKPQTGDLEKVKAARGEAGYTDKIDSTNVIFEENSKLAIKGTVNSTNAADEGCNGVVEGSASSCPIAFQTMKKSGSPFGEIEVNGGNLKIDGFKRGGIAPIKGIKVTNNGTMTFTNNGYGSNSAPIELDSGNIVATGNDIGFTSKLTTKGTSSVTVTGNKIIGVVLNASDIGGDTKLNITGNNTSNNANRGADLAINSTDGVRINGNAEVTVGNIRTYFTNDSHGLASGTDNSLKLNSGNASLTYDKLVEDNEATEQSKGAKVTPTNGVVKTDNTITVYGKVEKDITVKNGETLVVGSDATVSGKITAEAGAKIDNQSETELTVQTPSGELTVGKEDITIPAASSSSSSSSKKDYTIVENVVYADNGENIEIDGKIVKDTDETYKAMIKMAEDKGYKTLYNMYDFWVKDNKSLTKPVTITFNLGESYNGKMAYVIHKLHYGSYQELEAEVVDGKVSITVKELSPFTLSLKDNAVVDNPQTSSMNIVAYGILTTMSLVGIIVLVKKRNA